MSLSDLFEAFTDWQKSNPVSQPLSVTTVDITPTSGTPTETTPHTDEETTQENTDDEQRVIEAFAIKAYYHAFVTTYGQDITVSEEWPETMDKELQTFCCAFAEAIIDTYKESQPETPSITWHTGVDMTYPIPNSVYTGILPEIKWSGRDND